MFSLSRGRLEVEDFHRARARGFMIESEPNPSLEPFDEIAEDEFYFL
jgi:hypothetical protein